jgi:hypothetical protein
MRWSAILVGLPVSLLAGTLFLIRAGPIAAQGDAVGIYT